MLHSSLGGVESEEREHQVQWRRPARWTILQHDGPNHLGLLYNALPGHQMALIASGCVPFRIRGLPSRWSQHDTVVPVRTSKQPKGRPPPPR